MDYAKIACLKTAELEKELLPAVSFTSLEAPALNGTGPYRLGGVEGRGSGMLLIWVEFASPSSASVTCGALTSNERRCQGGALFVLTGGFVGCDVILASSFRPSAASLALTGRGVRLAV